MKGTPGRLALVKISGDPLALVDEACTDLGEHQVYQITNSAKRVLSPTAAITVNEDGVATVESYTINRLLGTISFATVDAARGAITISGSYLPLSTAARARSYSWQISATNADDTDFDSAFTEGMVRRQQSITDISGNVGRKWSIDTYFVDALMAGAPVVIEIFADRTTNVAEIICWALLNKQDFSAAMESIEDATVAFVGAADVDGRVVASPLVGA